MFRGIFSFLKKSVGILMLSENAHSVEGLISILETSCKVNCEMALLTGK